MPPKAQTKEVHEKKQWLQPQCQCQQFAASTSQSRTLQHQQHGVEVLYQPPRGCTVTTQMCLLSFCFTLQSHPSWISPAQVQRQLCQADQRGSQKVPAYFRQP